MRKALIFDLDGTLWDSSAQVAESWSIVGKRYCGTDFSISSEMVRSLMGKTMEEIGRAISVDTLTKPEQKKFVEECFDYERAYLKTHPGFLFPKELVVLQELSLSYDLFIVSNCQHGYIETFLPLVPKGIIQDYLCWSDTHAEKAVTISALLRKRNLLPDQAIYIGDTSGDETAAHGAGLRFLFAAYGFGVANGPEAVAKDFEDLLVTVPACFKTPGL